MWCSAVAEWEPQQVGERAVGRGEVDVGLGESAHQAPHVREKFEPQHGRQERRRAANADHASDLSARVAAGAGALCAQKRLNRRGILVPTAKRCQNTQRPRSGSYRTSYYSTNPR